MSYFEIETFVGAQSLDACKACRVHRFGGPDVITLEDVVMPKPGASEVVVRVKAAGVGPWDARIRAGHSALPLRQALQVLPSATRCLAQPIRASSAVTPTTCSPTLP
jgi:hypothetical protein